MNRSKEVEEAIKDLSLKAITSPMEALDFPSCIILKQDLLTALNYIEELEKENERFNNELDLDYVDKNFIDKQVIRDKIEEIKQKDEKYDYFINENGRVIYKEDIINILEELLGE